MTNLAEKRIIRVTVLCVPEKGKPVRRTFLVEEPVTSTIEEYGVVAMAEAVKFASSTRHVGQRWASFEAIEASNVVRLPLETTGTKL